jgi:RIO-like serine/threonine protein kinase
LKFYTPANRVRYENELAAFQILLLSSLDLVFPKPVAYAEWSTIKYGKTIGRNVPSITKPGDESIFVLMIDYIENSTPLSSSNVSHEVAKAAIVSLHKLHAIRILHGDISSSNSLLLDEHEPCTVMWVDFSSASINASDKTLALEMKRAINYFGAMVNLTKSAYLYGRMASEKMIFFRPQHFSHLQSRLFPTPKTLSLYRNSTNPSGFATGR